MPHGRVFPRQRRKALQPDTAYDRGVGGLADSPAMAAAAVALATSTLALMWSCPGCSGGGNRLVGANTKMTT